MVLDTNLLKNGKYNYSEVIFEGFVNYTTVVCSYAKLFDIDNHVHV